MMQASMLFAATGKTHQKMHPAQLLVLLLACLQHVTQLSHVCFHAK
jgi:hypothetical protein